MECSKDVRFHHCAFDSQAVGFALLAIAASHFPDELLDDISASRPCKITPCKSVRDTQRASAMSRHTWCLRQICETSTTPFAPIRMHTPFGPIKINDPSRVCRPDHTCYLRNIECIKMIAKQESRARASKPRAPRKGSNSILLELAMACNYVSYLPGVANLVRNRGRTATIATSF